jgi:uncharacterized protein (TIGR03067 family)
MVVVSLVLGACLVARAAPPEDVLRREQERLEGTWRVVAAEAGGAAIPAREFRDLTLTFKGGAFTARRGDEQAQAGTYSIDPARSPREMDITRGRDRQVGIYQVTGNTLKICAGPANGGRPTTFATRETPGATLLTLRRVP